MLSIQNAPKTGLRDRLALNFYLKSIGRFSKGDASICEMQGMMTELLLYNMPFYKRPGIVKTKNEQSGCRIAS